MIMKLYVFHLSGCIEQNYNNKYLVTGDSSQSIASPKDLTVIFQRRLYNFLSSGTFSKMVSFTSEGLNSFFFF